MRPRSPRSTLGHHHSDTFYVALLMALAAAAWEAVWVVLSLAGADPHGQLPQAFGRVTAAIHLATSDHTIPSWPQIAWDLGRPVSLVAVVLVVMGLALAGTLVVRLVLRVLGFSSGGGGWRRGGGGRGGPGGGQPPATVDKSLDEWLASVANGDDEE